VHLTFTGNYTVNEDGTGVLNLLVTLPSGATATATEDFVITEAEVIHGAPLATKIVNAQREPSLVLGNGVFVTQVLSRRPDRRSEGDEDHQ